MKYSAVFTFVYLACEAVSIASAVNCYTCQNCALPIAEGTTVSSGKTCTKCKIEFTLSNGGGPTGVNASCDEGSTCQASYTATAEKATVVSCCTQEKCNSLPGAAIRILPNFLAIFIPLLASL